MSVLPYRILVNSRSSGYSVYTDVFSQTAEGCQAGIDALKRDYHPCGYGTREEAPPKKSAMTGEWIATVYRQRSCD